MTEVKRSGVSWGLLGIGILFIIMSLLSFYNPGGNLAAIVLVFAIFAILKGIFEILVRNRLKKLIGYRSYAPLVLGGLNLLLGIYLLFNLGAGVIALSLVFAFWFIIESIFSMFTLTTGKKDNRGYSWFAIAINVIGLLIGLSLLFDPILSALTLNFMVGAYLMFFGIVNIVLAFKEA